MCKSSPLPPLSLYSVNGTFGSEPERGVADVGSKVDLSGIPLADALAQLVECRVQKRADVCLGQLRREEGSKIEPLQL